MTIEHYTNGIPDEKRTPVENYCNMVKENAMKAIDKDPWVHRSAGMQCVTCMWFASKVGTVSKIGRCRRHAPTLSGYPVVFENDWCGDHKLSEVQQGK